MHPSVFILLPHGLRVGGVTSWARALTSELRRRDRRAWLLHPALPKLNRSCRVTEADGLDSDTLVDLGPLPPLDRDPSSIDAWLDACRPAIEARTDGPAIWLPQQLGEGVSLGLELATDHDLRTVWVSHSPLAYNDQVARVLGPWLDAAVGVSTELADRLRAASAQTRIEAIPNGVEPGDTAPARAGGDRGVLELVWLGRVEQEAKRVAALPVLSRELALRGVPHRLTVIGDGPAMGWLRSRATPSMQLEGELAPLAAREHLARADALVQCSRYEGMSLAVLEAMAAGCAPIVTRTCSGLAGVIDHGETGLIAEVDRDADADRAGRALAELIAAHVPANPGSQGGWHEGLRSLRSLGAAARAHVIAELTLARQAQRFERLFETLVSMPSRASGRAAPPRFGSPGFGTVPADAAERMLERLGVLAGSTIALHGAGAHTRHIADRFNETGRGLAELGVVCVIDDNPDAWGSTLAGLPVVSPIEASAMRAQQVVISSMLHERSILSRRDAYERLGLRLHGLYEDAPGQASGEAQAGAAWGAGGERSEVAA